MAQDTTQDETRAFLQDMQASFPPLEPGTLGACTFVGVVVYQAGSSLQVELPALGLPVTSHRNWEARRLSYYTTKMGKVYPPIWPISQPSPAALPAGQITCNRVK